MTHEYDGLAFDMTFKARSKARLSCSKVVLSYSGNLQEAFICDGRLVLAPLNGCETSVILRVYR